jgi:hypothetical protein
MTLTSLTSSATWQRGRAWLTAGLILALLCLLAYWGGAAQMDARFWTGVLTLSALLLGFGGVTWWLFLSPVAASKRAHVQSLSPTLRQIVAYLATISALMFVIGAMWDEAWHRRYGIGNAIDDFFWEPHLMIYGSMGLTALFAIGGLLFMLRARGDVRLRFRAEPLIGMLALASAFMAFSAPSDLLWHRIYGLDITAWSLPHIFLSVSTTLVMLTVGAMHLAQIPRPAVWRGLGGLRGQEVLAMLMLAAGLVMFTLIAATEWDGLKVIRASGRAGSFWSRPEWLYPVILLAVAMLFGHIALHATRRIGFATLVTLVALVLRWSLIGLGGAAGGRGGIPVTAHSLIILPTLALDVWYWTRRRDADSPPTLIGGGTLVATVFGLLTILPLISAWMIYPRINAATVPSMVLYSLPVALWFASLGVGLGRWLGNLGATSETVEVANPRAVWVGAGALAVLALFTLVFMLTATPPTV